MVFRYALTVRAWQWKTVVVTFRSTDGVTGVVSRARGAPDAAEDSGPVVLPCLCLSCLVSARPLPSVFSLVLP